MPKKLPVATLKKQLKNLSQQESIALICSLYQSCPDAANILNARFGAEDYVKGLLAESKEKIEKEFSGRGMKVPSLSKAKKVISEFKKVSAAPENVLDLKLYYVECVAEFGSSFGAMPESFYDSLESVYSDVVDGLNKLASEDWRTVLIVIRQRRYVVGVARLLPNPIAVLTVDGFRAHKAESVQFLDRCADRALRTAAVRREGTHRREAASPAARAGYQVAVNLERDCLQSIIKNPVVPQIEIHTLLSPSHFSSPQLP